MSSDLSRQPAARTLSAAFLLTTALVALGACGKQGDPLPRPRAIPQAVQNLALRQRGDELQLVFSYPTSTLAGLPLESFESITLFELVRPVPAGSAKMILEPADFEAQAVPIVVLEASALANAIVGDRIRLGLELDAAALAGDTGRGYAVRTATARGDVSPWSNIVSLVPLPPPAPPEGVDVRAAADGVEVHWRGGAGTAGFAILRREATEPEWGEPVALLPAGATSYLDRGALYGTRYVYSVVALAGEDPPIESRPVHEREVDYRDLFPPAPPYDLRAVSLPGEVRLVWEASGTADLAGYLVERSLDGGVWSRLTDAPLTGLEFSDASAPAAGVVHYRLVAVDRSGNEATPTPALEIERR